MPTFVVAPMVPVAVPPLRLKTTVLPPVVRLLLNPSRACKVRVLVVPEAMLALLTVITELAALITPGVTVKVGSVLVTAEPPMVAPIVEAEPAVAPVRLAE